MPRFTFPTKKTRIVATIGPASRSPAVLDRLIAAGMNVARINFAHGDLEGHREVIRGVRAAADRMECRVAIMGDLPGPKMRIGRLRQEPIYLLRDQPFMLHIGDEIGDAAGAWMDFEGLDAAVQVGDSIFLNDGYVHLRVDRVEEGALHTTVAVGGELRSHKGVNIPGADLGIAAFTARDRELLAFAAAEEIDAVSQSFVARPEDILSVREAAHALGYAPMVIAKIERAKAVERIDAILDVADGIMVARGDLGVETPIQEVAAVQKRLILAAKSAAKPVITATQMLESMIHNSRPTRAEVTDVTNAILDGSDAVMLSGETAVGDYPEETVAMMARIAAVAESMPRRTPTPGLLSIEQGEERLSLEDEISLTAYQAIRTLRPDVIFAVTATGGTARRVARFGLDCWIVAFSPNEATCQRLQFTRGVHSVAPGVRPASWAEYARAWVQENELDMAMGLLSEGGGTLRASGATRIELIDLHLRDEGG